MKKSKTLFLTLLILMLAGVLSACSGAANAASSWPGMTVDPERELVYVAYNNQVLALNTTNGNLAWNFPSEPDNKITFFAPPAITPDGEQVIVGAYNNLLYSLNPENGQQSTGNWPFAGAGNRYIGGPVALSDRVLAPNADMKLYSVDLNGALQWSLETGEPLWSGPVANGSTVYQPSMDHHVYAANLETGELVWQSGDLGGAMVGQPTLSGDGVLYIGTFASEMLALDTSNGAVLWRSPTNGWVWSGPTLSDGVLYFGDLNGVFYAIDAGTGQQVWTVEPEVVGPDYSISDRPLVVNDTVYYTSESGVLYAVDAQTGSPRWNKTVGGKLYASPALAGDLILVAPIGADNLVIAYDLDGNQQWAYTPAE